MISPKDTILELNLRRAIYNAVRRYAGCHFRELERKLKLPASSLKYHLDYLHKHQLITEEKDGNTLRYFPREFNLDKALLGVLRQRSMRKIIMHLALHKDLTHEEIVRYVRLSPSTVSWHLKKLENKGIITSRKHGALTRYLLAVEMSRVIGLLITYQENFLDALVDKVIELWELE